MGKEGIIIFEFKVRELTKFPHLALGKKLWT
jgi:hypothetical protein